MNFTKIGLQVPRILLPKDGTDMHRWAVIACDQHTSDREYWRKLDEYTGDAISTLRLIFPEVYLNDDDVDERIAAINATMKRYLDDGSLVEHQPGFILVDRQTAHVPSRKGLMVALDLEQYDFSAGATTLIRASEGTILDRLPPRIKVRRDAPIELPHIMVLIDDPERTVIEPLLDQQLQCAYDFDLAAGGGHIRGWHVDSENLISQVVEALSALADPQRYREKYHTDEVMLYAMGDGNHSFATAKQIWEQLKRDASDKDAIMNHPARYALVELVNVHDDGLEFDAIHRVLFNVDTERLLPLMEAYFAERGTPFTFTPCSDYATASGAIVCNDEQHSFPAQIGGTFGVCTIKQPEYTIDVATLQGFIDHYLQEHPQVEIDYIHGVNTVTNLAKQPGNVGFYLSVMSKHDLFRTIVHDGALPRKSFSMGNADEKRFYLECRRIK